MHKAVIDPYRVGQTYTVGVIDPPASFDGLEAAHGLQAKGIYRPAQSYDGQRIFGPAAITSAAFNQQAGSGEVGPPPP